MKKMKICILMVMLILGSSFSVYADTITFNVTVNKDKVNEDNYSRKVSKAGGTSYENRYYVTPTSFPIRDTVHVFSRQEDNVNCTSYPCSLVPGKENITLNNPYTGDAPSGKMYRLHAYFGGKSGSAQVLGRFTP